MKVFQTVIKADIGHNHVESDILDLDKYTQAEVNTISGSLQTNIDGKSDTGHTHTESDITDLDHDAVKLRGRDISSTDTPDNGESITWNTANDEWRYTMISGGGGGGTSNHSELNELDYASAGHTGFQPAGDYATDVGLTTVSGDLQTNIDGKSDIGHTHTESDITDLDKYTQAEVNTISGALSTEIDSDISTHASSADHDGRYYTETEIDTIKTNFINPPLSSQVLTGLVLSSGTNVGTAKVSAGTALLRTTDDQLGILKQVDVAEHDNITITTSGIIYTAVLQYNDGSPKIVLQEEKPNGTTNISIGKFILDSLDIIHYLNCGYRFNSGVNKLHNRLEEIRPWEMCNSLVITDESLKQFSISEGCLFKGINAFEFTKFDTSDTDVFIYVYYDGTDWVYVEDQTEIDVDNYNNTATGLVTCNQYKCDWVFLHPDDGHVYVVYGQDNATLATVYASTIPVGIPDLIDLFGALIGRIIIDGGVATFYEIEMVQTTTFNTTIVTNHSDLSNLQGGTTNEYYHLTSSRHADLTDGGNCSIHKHDDRYYTETEVDTISGSLQTNIDAKDNYSSWSFAVDGVTKDAVTSGDILNFVGGDNITVTRSADDEITISGTVASGGGTTDHSALSNLDYASAGHTGFQPAGEYATDVGLTTVSGDLQTNIDGKSDIGHTHTESDITDLDKYTKAEVNTISGALSTEIDSDISIHSSSADHDGRYYTETEVNTISGTLQTQIITNKDHGNLDGLTDDDHPQYLLIDGTRVMTGALDLDSNNINNINVVNLKAISCIVHNNTGATLTAGTCVYPNGVVNGIVCVNKCDITDVTKMPCLGIISMNINNGDNGKAVCRGIKNMDTSGFAGAIGDRIYVQSDGSTDTVEPTSGSIQRVGILNVKAVDGQIYIHSRGRKSIFAAANEHPEIRMGNDAGHQKICFLDYDDNEVGCIDNNGNLTLSGTADGVDISTFKSDYDGHTHTESDITDLDKYTQAEVNTISGALSTEIDSDISIHSSSADHDGRYYTETEVDALTWTESDITDLDKYTQAEINTISGALSTEIDSDISTHSFSADHDGRYYTETEINTISGSLNDKITTIINAIPAINYSANGLQCNSINAGESISVMDCVYLKSDGEWWKTSASGEETGAGMLAISLENKTDGQPMCVAMPGTFIRNDSWTWDMNENNRILYLSCTSGDLTQITVSGVDNVVRIVGHATHANRIFFNPEQTIVIHS